MSRLDGRRILVIEDEVIIGMMATDMLEDMGATVLGPAMTLNEALSIAEATDADAALVDINLDGTRSDAVVELLARRGVPIVFTTGYGRTEATGDRPVLEKPYTAEGLAAALASALEGGA